MVFNKASLTRGITLAANILAKEMRRVTSVGGRGGYPSEIPASITVDPAAVTDTRASITISSVANDKKRQAVAITLAYELGSGLFGKKKRRYKITPGTGKDLLAFPGSEWEAYMTPPDRPLTFIFPEVEHPGIRPKPFIIDSIVGVSDKMMDVLGQNFVLEILDGPRVEIIK